MRRNNCPFKKDHRKYSQRNAGNRRPKTGNYKPSYTPITDGGDDGDNGLYATYLHFPPISYSCGLRVTENAGLSTLEAYKKRIPSHIRDMDSIDEDFWSWAGSIHLPTVRCTNSERVIQLLNEGQAAAVFTQTRII
jgi:hypothetical protein